MDWMIIYIIVALLIIPVFIYGLICQANVNSTFNKYSKKLAESGITAAELAERLLESQNITNVNVFRINGKLSDCYDSRNKVVKLSDEVYNSSSIAALGVCAHEIGHACQDAKKNFLFRLRQIIIPVTNFITKAFIPLILIGAVLNSLFYLPIVGYYITFSSVILYGASLLVYFVTLPLEYDASKKALAMLEKNEILNRDDLKGAKAVLKAAIHTYIAAFMSSLVYFLRFLSYFMILTNERK